MFGQVLSSAAMGLMASSLVSAQTFTDCNPLKEDCPANPAFGKGVTTCNFVRGECSAFKENLDSMIKYEKSGAKFTIKKETNAPTITTGKYIFFGRVDVEVQAAPGQGIVTAVVLQSDTLDEIDWEWLGGDTTQVQSNYFSKGDTSTYDRGAFHTVSDPQAAFHKYTIEWNKDVVQWIIDGQVVRTLKAAEVKGFPESPMQIKLGTWCAGGSQTELGTLQWSGGLTDFSKAPFDAYYKSVTIVDYAGGNGPAIKGVKEYVYGDKSGSADSIEIKYGSSSDEDDKKTFKEYKPKPTGTLALTGESGAEEKGTSYEKNQPAPTGSSTETGTSGDQDNQTPPTVSKPNDGLVKLNFTATPIGIPTPDSTGSFGGDAPHSAASRGIFQGRLIAGILLVVVLAI